jgi:hypothetical protein
MQNKISIICFVIICLFFLSINAQAEIIFQDDFNYTWTPPSSPDWELYPCTKLEGGACTNGISNYPISKYVAGERNNSNSWNGWKRTNDSYSISIEDSVGRDGSGGLKITYPTGNGISGEVGLIKWLGQEYDEVYIRWYFRFEDEGNDRWSWGSGTSDSFGFWKLGRIYQGIDPLHMRHKADDANNYFPHPNSYPDYTIPYFGNSGGPLTRPLVIDFLAVAQWDEWPGTMDNVLWRAYHRYRAYGGHPVNPLSFITPDDGSSDYVCGPLYTAAEDVDKAGEFKLPQTWHSLEMHIRLREMSLTGASIPAIYIDSTHLKVQGDYSSTLTPGTLIECGNTGQFDGYNAPVVHEIEDSIFDETYTTFTLIDQPSINKPHLTSSLDTIVVVEVNDQGLFEVKIDGVDIGNHTMPTYDKTFFGSSLFGGISFIIFIDNMDNDRSHPITVYIDDFVVSTTEETEENEYSQGLSGYGWGLH